MSADRRYQQKPIFDVHPVTGATIEIFLRIGSSSAGAARVGSGACGAASHRTIRRTEPTQLICAQQLEHTKCFWNLSGTF